MLNTFTESTDEPIALPLARQKWQTNVRELLKQESLEQSAWMKIVDPFSPSPVAINAYRTEELVRLGDFGTFEEHLRLC